MDAEYAVVFTAAAEKDLNGTLQYLSGSLENPGAAAGFILRIEKITETLSLFPLSGSPVENPYVRRSGIRKMPVENYVLYYLPEEERRTVVILRIVYGHRDRTAIEAQM